MQPCIIELFKYLKVGTIASCFGLCQSGDTVHVFLLIHVRKGGNVHVSNTTMVLEM